MCRNIKRLRLPEQVVSEDEIRLAALQFVRKVSGFRQPSQRNRLVFEQAVDEIAAATRKMLEALEASQTIHHRKNTVK